MKSFLSRMNAKHLMVSLAISLSLANCSSKHGASTGADNGAATSDMQAEEEMMLGEGEATQSDEVAAVDQDNLDTSSASNANSSIEALPDGSPSLPVGQGSGHVWKGTLKSKYEAGMTEWTVGRGESLSLIAAAVYGRAKDWKKLVELNPEVKNPNALVVGQKLRLPSADGNAQFAQESEPATKTPVGATTQTSSQSSEPSNKEPMPTVTNTEVTATSTTVATPPAPDAAAAPGAMGVVDTAPATPAASDGALSGLVKKVDISGNKLKLRNILLGVAAFFLLLSGLIFVLSRRKAKAG